MSDAESVSVNVKVPRKGKKVPRSRSGVVPQRPVAGASVVPADLRLGAQAVPVVSRSRDEVQRTALLASVVGQPFEDVKFWVFSRRTLDGAADTPLPLLANSSLIRKASLHFGFLFTAGFAESGIADMDAPYPSTRLSFTEFYDYASDSDLEDQDEEASAAIETVSLPVDEDSRVHDGSPALADEEKPPESSGKGKQRATPDKSKDEDHAAKIAKPGKVVFLEDIAYATWKAFIVYAYLGELNFAPLRSENKTRPSRCLHSHGPPPCSPKSMYRLAEKYDIVDLKQEALKSIQSKLSPHNILEEIFSTFTSLYPAVQAMELEYLHAHGGDTGIQARLPKWLEAMEDGHLPKGAAGIVASLLAKYTAPPPPPSPYGCNTTTSMYCNSCRRTY
ncbi:hypothetical protein OH76DRAFT_1403001 [Lentinus brumalis]|uniref:BTB domain-containing protein n=1 Tax=Lentinus brumalis TaxID=2498619 RepID=A0A371DC91_9APHY|nr:hypothetical protein OH76DRAFT_1403001 [Polyporus brumalis]